MADENLDRCGGCTLCCDLLAVEALDKKAYQPCQHCEYGVGCSLFGSDDRPLACSAFQCAYYFNSSWPLSLRPDRCGVVFEPFGEGEELSFVAMVAPENPGAWREGAGASAISRMVRHGHSVIVVVGETKHVLLPEGQTPSGVWDIYEKAARQVWQHPFTPPT